jgi:protein-arginine kinase activator protein McsA
MTGCSETTAKQCQACGTTQSDYWRGMREGRVRCLRCYQKERQQVRKLQKRKARAMTYDWGWE